VLQLALALCKPCDLVFLVHVVMVVGHINSDSFAVQPTAQNRSYASSSKNLLHGFNNESESKAAYLASKYKQLGFNLHVEKVVLPYDYQLDTLTSAEMTEGLPKPKEYLNDRLVMRRNQLAEAFLKCVNAFDPTFVIVGSDDYDIGYVFEGLKSRSLAEIEAAKAREQRHYRLKGQSQDSVINNDVSMYGSLNNSSIIKPMQGLMRGGQLENDAAADGGQRSHNFDDLCDTDEAFEAEINALASICEHSTMSNSTAHYLNSAAHEDVTSVRDGDVIAPTVPAKISQCRSFAEAVMLIGSDVTRRGGKRGVGRSIEKFSFVFTAPPKK
jgi:hypothetical protein